MKTIVHFKTDAYLYPTENWIHAQINRIKKYKSIVYCSYKQNQNVYFLENIRRFGFKNLILNKFLNNYNFTNPLILLYLKKDKPCIIHAYFGPAGFSMLPLKEKLGFPLITSFYGFDISKLPKTKPVWRKRYAELFYIGECFVAEGNNMKKELIKLGCNESKIYVNHIGVNTDYIKFTPRKIGPKEEIKILMAGRFTEKKGLLYGIEAFAIVKKKYPKIKLTIIGGPTTRRDNIEKEKIYKKIIEFNLQDSVYVAGIQPHSFFINELYKNYIYIAPSILASDGDSEGGAPVSLIEASASGMPVIATDHCDIPEVVIDGETGFLVKEKDPKELASKLMFLIENPNSWYDIGLKGRRHIENNFEIKKQVEKLENVYNIYAK